MWAGDAASGIPVFDYTECTETQCDHLAHGVEDVALDDQGYIFSMLKSEINAGYFYVIRNGEAAAIVLPVPACMTAADYQSAARTFIAASAGPAARRVVADVMPADSLAMRIAFSHAGESD